MVTKKAQLTADVVTLLEEISGLASDLEMSVDGLNIAKPQSLSNDFSEPLVIAESIVEMCTRLMNTNDKREE